jgi:teichuronic acid biosynthesis glycosyltransferase TuaC
MKVLVFTSLYPNNIWPHHGVFVKERMTHFAALEGCEVVVVAPTPYFPPLKINHRWLFSQVKRSEVIDGLAVHHPRYFMIPKVGMTLHGWLMFLAVLPAIKRLRKAFDFDLIDAHYIYPDGFAAVLLGYVFRRPVVVSARGTDVNLFKEFPLIRRLLRLTLRRADGIIAVCQALKESIAQLGISPARVTVIPNGVDPRKFYPVPREEARKRLGLPDGRLIVSIGNLIPRKGFDLLIQAFGRLVAESEVKNLYLAIVGEGPARRELESLIAGHGLGDYIRLAGDVPHQDLYLWYNAADLFCLASLREGWANVLLESLACGTPVVATAVWGTPEVIRSDAVGLLAERSAQDMAEKIALALQKTWHSDDIVRYAREHTWDRVTPSVFHVFASVLSRHRGLPHGQANPSPRAIHPGMPR